MEKICDLHTHSNFSDGSFSPTRLVEMAVEAGLSAIALTDHNTVAGLPEFVEAAKRYPIEAVPGTEFSVDYEGRELHLLGLFIGEEHYGVVNALLDEGIRQKEESNKALIERLSAAGYEMDYEAIKAKTPNGQVNRSHIATALTEWGYTSNNQEAFDKLLSAKRGFYIAPPRPDVFQVIRFLKSIGAVTVLAHPFLNLKTEEELRRFLTEAKPAGLDGMETIYTLFVEEKTRLAKAIADEFGLKHSGGSDFHGASKPDTALGTGKGNVKVPLELLERLKER